MKNRICRGDWLGKFNIKEGPFLIYKILVYMNMNQSKRTQAVVTIWTYLMLNKMILPEEMIFWMLPKVNILPVLKTKINSCCWCPMAFISQASPVSPKVYPNWIKEVYSSKSCCTSVLYRRPKESGFTGHLFK